MFATHKTGMKFGSLSTYHSSPIQIVTKFYGLRCEIGIFIYVIMLKIFYYLIFGFIYFGSDFTIFRISPNLLWLVKEFYRGVIDFFIKILFDGFIVSFGVILQRFYDYVFIRSSSIISRMGKKRNVPLIAYKDV